MRQEYISGTHAASPTGVFLVIAWAVLSGSLLRYVLEYGHNQPWADEWEFVPELTGHEPLGPFFLHPHNEHRLPLPRLIYIGLWEATHDFRSGMVLQVLLLSAMAYRGMRLAAWLRGAPHWADAFFPVSLLHVGHSENLLMGYQLCFVLASALACAVLELALRLTPRNGVRTALGVALAALALALSGGFGIVLATPIIVWTAMLVVRYGRRNATQSGLAIFWMLATVAYCGYYFATYERPPAHPPFEWKNWTASLQVAGEFLAIAFGIGVGPVWFAVLPVLLAALGWAAFAAFRHSEDRLRWAGIAAVAAGVILLSLAVGAGRGGFGADMGLWPRYSVLAWPLIAALYFSCLLARGPIRRWLSLALLAVAVLAFLPNSISGILRGKQHDKWLGDIAQELREGEPVEAIVERSLSGGQEDRARRGIPMLSAAKIGPFAGWTPRP